MHIQRRLLPKRRQARFLLGNTPCISSGIADRFELLARCTLGSRPVTVRLGSGDPIFPPETEPRRFDSRLEERFARDITKLAWPGYPSLRQYPAFAPRRSQP